MVMPIHYKGRLVGFSGTIAHLPDIGGSLWACDCRELFEEGLRILPVKLYEAGRLNQTVVDFIVGNVRVPDQVMGDIEAQVTANTVGGRRLCEFLEDTGVHDLGALSEALQQRAEHAMRQAIAAVPDGVYRSTVRADGFDADETRIECAVTVRGSELSVDYAGTSKQIDRGLNSVMNYTYAYTVYPIKCALDPLTPRNEGSYRSVTVSALGGKHPQSALPGSLQCASAHRTPAGRRRLWGAEPSHPGPADRRVRQCAHLALRLQRLRSRGQPLFPGPFRCRRHGASAIQDGHACIAFPTNTGSGSIEAFEAISPLIVWRKELLQDFGGIGKHRGGLGQVVELEVVAPSQLRLSLLSDRQKYAAQGLFGGGPGAPVRIAMSGARTPHPKSRTTIDPLDRLVFSYSGGGGYGNPRERHPDAVQRDVRNGYVSIEAARRDYGFKS